MWMRSLHLSNSLYEWEFLLFKHRSFEGVFRSLWEYLRGHEMSWSNYILSHDILYVITNIINHKVAPTISLLSTQYRDISCWACNIVCHFNHICIHVLLPWCPHIQSHPNINNHVCLMCPQIEYSVCTLLDANYIFVYLMNGHMIDRGLMP